MRNSDWGEEPVCIRGDGEFGAARDKGLGCTFLDKVTGTVLDVRLLEHRCVSTRLGLIVDGMWLGICLLGSLVGHFEGSGV